MNKTVKDYLDWKASYSPSAARNYRIWLERFLEWTQKDPEEIEISDYVKYKTALDIKYAPTTIQLAIIGIKDFYKYLYENEIPVKMKYKLIKVPKAKARSYTPITEEEYKKMLRWCSISTYDELQKTIIIRLLWDTGVRVSELCSLDISSMHLPKAYGVVVTKKNNQQRMIFWSKETHELLIRYLGIRLTRNQQPALFQARSARIVPRTIQRIVQDFVKRTGIRKRLTCHSFRHGKAHQVLLKGGTVADIAAILGHLAPESSFTYLQMQNKELEARARMFL